MERRTRKEYNADFKRQSVELWVRSRRTAKSIEGELGLYQGALRHWRDELAEDPQNIFPGTGRLKVEETEVQLLRRENEILREERDILKKAAAIFLKPPKAGINL
jgi:transposase